MPDVTRVHPTAVNTGGIDFFISRENCTFLEVDFGAAVNAKTGPESTIAKVIEQIADSCTILIKGDLVQTNQVMMFLVEHPNDTDTYDGSASETLAQHIEDKIQGLGTVDSINLASAACIVKASMNFA